MGGVAWNASGYDEFSYKNISERRVHENMIVLAYLSAILDTLDEV